MHYAGPSNTFNGISCRNFLGWTGVVMKIPQNSFERGIDLILKITVWDNSFGQTEAQPTRIYVSHNNQEWFNIGRLIITGKQIWPTWRFSINHRLLRADNIWLRIDDFDNQKLGFGKTLSSIALYRE